MRGEQLSAEGHERGLLARLRIAAEQQGDPDGIQIALVAAPGFTAEPDQLALPVGGDLVDGAGGAPAELLAADGLDEPFILHAVQLAVEGAHVHPAPGLHAADLGDPADLTSPKRATRPGSSS